MTIEPGTAHGSGLSPNFSHLAHDFPLLAHHGAKAERYVFEDPSVAIFKLRRFGEVLAAQIAAMLGVRFESEASQFEILRALQERSAVEYEVADLFHILRKAGNDAVHQDAGTQRSALHLLRTAWRLGNWFQRAFRDPNDEPAELLLQRVRAERAASNEKSSKKKAKR